MRADGTDETRLTTNPAEDREPAWSPDGTKIAFFRAASGIYVMDADGTGVTLVTPTPGRIGLPAWSPDGTKIAFDGLRPIRASISSAPTEAVRRISGGWA